MNNLMIDLETMGNRANAAIVAIGAVFFDKNGIGKTSYDIVDLQSSVDAGGEIDPSTVIWWLQQSDSARAIFSLPGLPEEDCLIKLRRFILENVSKYKDLRIWGNGAAFDNVILKSAFLRHKICPPWEYHNDRCFRTFKALYPRIKFENSGTKHNALDDAIAQAQFVVKALNSKKEK